MGERPALNRQGLFASKPNDQQKAVGKAVEETEQRLLLKFEEDPHRRGSGGKRPRLRRGSWQTSSRTLNVQRGEPGQQGAGAVSRDLGGAGEGAGGPRP